ncbi:MAG: hypothetical protein AVO34_10440 [Firmicutes bacterium ML8_F2]|jgi:radical SAM superfamily enzyme YgiQ (UPF0313 family)|nr:MAG: hypothetical protein AVO34_10440 [Firmicutes bacterium ML8_F2]
MALERFEFEQGPIRPPSEAGSLLIRLTRNCPWNRCLFCPVYKKEKFSRRPVAEIKADISAMAEAAAKIRSISDSGSSPGGISRQALATIQAEHPELLQIAYWLYSGGKNVFLQDGDSLLMPLNDLLDILGFLKEKFPAVDRITTYARSKTLLRFSQSEIKLLGDHGLSRIHVGLESGSDQVLDYMKKGVTGEQHTEAGLRVKAAGLSLSYYVILGLGGQLLWRVHALDTAKVINRVNPDFIRMRTLAIHPASPLYDNFLDGSFLPLTDDQVIREELLFVESLEGIDSYLVSDHILNLLEEVEGQLPVDKEQMIGIMKRYLDWSAEKREIFRLGRRTGNFKFLNDLEQRVFAQPVEESYRQLQKHNISVDEQIRQLMLRFI